MNRNSHHQVAPKKSFYKEQKPTLPGGAIQWPLPAKIGLRLNDLNPFKSLNLDFWFDNSHSKL